MGLATKGEGTTKNDRIDELVKGNEDALALTASSRPQASAHSLTSSFRARIRFCGATTAS
jgi:hypothetical protein